MYEVWPRTRNFERNMKILNGLYRNEPPRCTGALYLRLRPDAVQEHGAAHEHVVGEEREDLRAGIDLRAALAGHF